MINNKNNYDYLSIFPIKDLIPIKWLKEMKPQVAHTLQNYQTQVHISREIEAGAV